MRAFGHSLCASLLELQGQGEGGYFDEFCPVSVCGKSVLLVTQLAFDTYIQDGGGRPANGNDAPYIQAGGGGSANDNEAPWVRSTFYICTSVPQTAEKTDAVVSSARLDKPRSNRNGHNF